MKYTEKRNKKVLFFKLLFQCVFDWFIAYGFKKNYTRSFIQEGRSCVIEYNLKRFLDAQERDYAAALQEIKNGKKRSHWMWYIFPQIAGLGLSSTSRYYAISNVEEAKEYMRHSILKMHMLEICEALLLLDNKEANTIFGFPDNLKLKSSMTLFEAATPEYTVFKEVLEQYFHGERDEKTINIIGSGSEGL